MTDARPGTDDAVLAGIDTVYRSESRHVFATLVRLLGDFDLAEDALHDAFVAAAERWRRDGFPRNPRAWLVSVGRFKAIDALRRRARFDASLAHIAEHLVQDDVPPDDVIDDPLEDDRLRLIFTCCHPALSPRARISLTLREVCGLQTEEIARSFFTTAAAVARQIVRAKARIRNAGIPYEVPCREDIPERLETVLRVVYMVYTEGYAPARGSAYTREDLSVEAIRLGRVLAKLLPEPEVMGLLALMLLHEARRPARSSHNGDLVLLEDQDRRLWDRGLIDEGLPLVDRALRSRAFGPYTLQAAIAAVHAEAASPPETDWAQIAGLYDVLLRIERSPVIELNRAVAIAMRDGPTAGLALVDALLARGELREYHLAHAVRADFARRLGRRTEAAEGYRSALALAALEPERRFIERRLEEVTKCL